MSIGGTLAKARRDAGLTVAEVSQRTRIRETIVRGIEQDDYSACGGDFYARGHVRSIARVVGADAAALVGEYDATLRAPEGITAAEALEPLLPIGSRGGGHPGGNRRARPRGGAARSRRRRGRRSAGVAGPRATTRRTPRSRWPGTRPRPGIPAGTRPPRSATCGPAPACSWTWAGR